MFGDDHARRISASGKGVGGRIRNDWSLGGDRRRGRTRHLTGIGDCCEASSVRNILGSAVSLWLRLAATWQMGLLRVAANRNPGRLAICPCTDLRRRGFRAVLRGLIDPLAAVDGR